MKKRIVWITPDYFYDVDWPIVGQLKDYYDIRWYVIWGKDSYRDVPKDNNIFKFIKSPYRYRDLRVIKLYISLIKEMKQFNPSIIYSGFSGIPFFYPVLFCMFDRHRIIYEGHEIDPYNYVKHDFVRVNYVKYFMRRVGLTQVFSKSTEKQFYRLYPKQKCTYIPMVPKDYGASSNLIDHQGKKVFLFFGGLRKTKRLDLLVDAFLTLDEKSSEKAELWVYGKGSENDNAIYEERVKGHNNIVLKLDYVPDSLVADLFCSSTYLVLPYEQITQSGPMMISFNYNLPIISSDIEGLTERVENGENGYVFRKNDVQDLKRVLELCIDQNEEDYMRIKQNLKVFVDQEYSPNVVIKRYCDMLNKFIDENEE